MNESYEVVKERNDIAHSNGNIYYKSCVGKKLSNVNWKQIQFKNDKVLYENTSGSNGTITLSETSANFSYIEIFYKTNDEIYSSVKVPSPNGKIVSLMSQWSGTVVYLKTKMMSISGTTITNHSTTAYSEVKLSQTATVENTNNIYMG